MDVSPRHIVLILALCSSLVTSQTSVSESNKCDSDQECPLNISKCNTSLGQCEAVSCQSDEDCTGENTRCADTKLCDCSVGFSNRNGLCTKDLGRPCTPIIHGRSPDCGSSTQCNADTSQCECYSFRGYYNDMGICTYVIGTTCTRDIECNVKTNLRDIVCQDGSCVCKDGYTLTNNYCNPTVGHSSRCTNDSDCPVENTECVYSSCQCTKGYGQWQDSQSCVKVIGQSCSDVTCHISGIPVYCSFDNICSCPYGYTQGGNTSICIPVYGRSCVDDSDCGSSPRFRCESGNCTCSKAYWKEPTDHTYHYYNESSVSIAGYQCISPLGRNCTDNQCALANGECGEDSACACKSGTVVNDGTCVPMYGRSCVDDSDCGSSPRFRCESGNCTCSKAYWKEPTDHTYHYYNESSVSIAGYQCISPLGRNCTDNQCALANGECGEDSACACKSGTVVNDGTCVPILGLPCKHDVWCQNVTTTRCGVSERCECRPGFKRNDTACLRVLGSPCDTSADCPLPHSTCNSEGVCECEADYPQFGDQCLINACHVDTPVIPDLNRRFQTYTQDYNYEHTIQDTSLAERWYSIGPYNLSTSANPPPIGGCGTYYPIYLENPLTEEQKLDMESRVVAVTAIVGGIDTEPTFIEISEEKSEPREIVEVKLQKCGDETLVYLTAPQTRMSAYCLESEVDRANDDIRRDIYIVPRIQSQLGFYEDTIDGILMSVPYTYYECSYGSEQREGVAFAVNWYTDDTHIATYGPATYLPSVNTRLTDIVIREKGFRLGVVVRCSVEVASTLSGTLSYPMFSNSFTTGLADTDNWSWTQVNENTTFFSPVLNSPLGCMTAVNDASLYCTLRLNVLESSDNDAICTSNHLNSTDRHPDCGITLIGLSKKGLQASSSTRWSSQYGTNSSHSDRFGSYIETDLSLDEPVTLKLQLTGEATGHKMWDELLDVQYQRPTTYTYSYTYYNIRVLWYDYCTTDPYTSQTMVAINGNGVISQYSVNIDLRGMVEFEADSEYILVRSSTHPVEAHIKTKFCGYPINGACICAVTIRNGNDIYTTNYCGKAPIVGSLYGSSVQQSYQLLLNGMGISSRYISGRVWVTVTMPYNVSTNTEGLCGFERDSFRWRDGTTTSEWMVGFSTSWKISERESLLNPINHVQYGYDESFVLCDCPTSTQEIPTSPIVENSINYHFTGTMRCMAKNRCTTSHPGKYWKPSLRSTIAVDSVSVSSALGYKVDNPVIKLKCNFEAITGYLYIIQWIVNGNSVLRSGYLQVNETDTFHLTDDYVTENTDIKLFVDIPIICGVSVHSSNREQIKDMVLSKSFYPVEILNTEVTIVRGDDAIINLKQNIPFGCSLGPDCRLQFRLFDPDDNYDCKDSTIAVKSPTTCGMEIKGAMSKPEVTVLPNMIPITITTKNNNNYNLRTRFSLKIRTIVLGNGNPIYEGEFAQNITVTVRDNGLWHYKTCYANNDPRMGTFDRIPFGMQLVGSFIMYRHTALPLEVQMMTQSCNGGWASCSCGVAVRAGRDVYVINHCYGHHITGYLLNDDKILTVRRRSTTRYQIYMPHGTMVDVFVSPWRWYMVNINIYPSPTDLGNVEGLCGDFNGVRSDDLRHRDGTVTPVGPDYRYYNPDTFSRSWRIAENTDVSAGESLLDITRINESLASWSVDEQLCVCPQKGASVVCAVNEEDTCTKPVNRLGEEVAQKTLNYDYANRLEYILKRNAADNTAERPTMQPTNLSEANATDICREAMEASCALYQMKDDIPYIDAEEIVQNCGRDLAINASISWSGESCARYQAEVDTELERDGEFKKNNTEVVAKINAQNCVGNCSSHGVCNKGTCDCFPGYANDDCSADLNKTPEITYAQGDGTCNPEKDGDCNCILIVTSGNAQNATCRMSQYTARTNGTFIKTEDEETTAIYENFNEIFCCKTTSRKPSTQANLPDAKNDVTDGHDNSKDARGSNDVVLGVRLLIIFSNNGVIFSNGVYIAVLDPTCQNYVITAAGDVVALLKTGFCFIGGHCYAESAVNPTASCRTCDTRKATYVWTEDDCDQQTSKDDDFNVFLIVVIAIGTVIALTLVIGLVAFFYYKSKRANGQSKSSMSPRMADYLTNTPGNSEITGGVPQRTVAGSGDDIARRAYEAEYDYIDMVDHEASTASEYCAARMRGLSGHDRRQAGSNTTGVMDAARMSVLPYEVPVQQQRAVRPTTSARNPYITPTTSARNPYITPTTAAGNLYITPTTAAGNLYITPTTAAENLYITPTTAAENLYITPTTAAGNLYITPTHGSGVNDGE